MGNENHEFLPEMGDQEGPQQGPSWGNPRWLETVADSGADLTAALDPTRSGGHAAPRARLWGAAALVGSNSRCIGRALVGRSPR
jgi:2-oxoglutarate dehydrogenase E1 component